MFPYQDPNLPVEQRIDDLLSRMTLREKILQTDQYYSGDFTTQDENGLVTHLDMDRLDTLLGGYSAGSLQLRGMSAAQANTVQRYAMEKTRLGIPFLFSEEALHGLMTGKATSFPQQIGLAATFHPELGREMGRAIGTEARAQGIHETYSPVMDLIRDPRYGRGEESYGEDTHLCAEFARETVLGLQGRDLSEPDAVAAEPKHYVGYGNPVGGLNCAPCTMGRHDVFSDCLPVFEAAFVDGGASDVMCSYNSIDSIPVSMDHELLTDVLRGQFGMKGFVRTDLTAVSRLYDWHFIAPTPEEAIRLGLEAGVDLQLYDFPHDVWQNGIENLINSGKLDPAILDTCCRRVLGMKFRLGLFEHPYTDESLAPKALRCPEHLDLARRIARESVVLLKNDGILPLKKDVKSIAVIGPGADTPALGDYTETRGRSGEVTVLEGIRAAVSPDTRVIYARGCNYLKQPLQPFDPAMLLDEEGNPGLTGRYYNGPEPKGEPIMVRTDRTINFNWIFALPHSALDANCFSVAWDGWVCMPETIDGCIGLSTQDSMRLYVDGQLLVDGWGPDKSADQALDFRFEADRRYKVRIEFVNDGRGARVIFGYSAQREDIPAAVAAAKQAEVAVVCVGDNEETSGENFDRTSLDLPGRQLDLVKAVYATGTPVVLLMQSGRPVTANWENEHLAAILEAWFPGEQGGAAVADVLFGDAGPSGRLPITFPRSVGQVPCHYSRRPGGGKKYVEMDWLPLYPFGYGLAYTTFEYTGLELDRKEIAPGDTLTVRFTVTNTGDRPGVAVPQVYVRDYFSSVVKPERQLAAFTRVELAPGESRTVSVPVGPRALRTLGPDYVWRVEPGDFEIQLGDNAEHILLRTDMTVRG